MYGLNLGIEDQYGLRQRGVQPQLPWFKPRQQARGGIPMGKSSTTTGPRQKQQQQAQMPPGMMDLGKSVYDKAFGAKGTYNLDTPMTQGWGPQAAPQGLASVPQGPWNLNPNTMPVDLPFGAPTPPATSAIAPTAAVEAGLLGPASAAEMAAAESALAGGGLGATAAETALSGGAIDLLGAAPIAGEGLLGASTAAAATPALAEGAAAATAASAAPGLAALGPLGIGAGALFGVGSLLDWW